mmetsp:Transcript_191/g.419  ORF Transcript_191/g.419 Transcript_191/m.419 type:complete len:395 (-) Transcript_191:289-1473(-)|eukprot:CAMPEP_0119378498 /NCGR_PEP_ID=MMETSP1334-20130426/48538_1 /TAXON_ID=127549 /ORGANISM="Calcidiscus leptoporus, Strain RCC1130" /LENGTH=394 /DNA_ID=CAMNT_0007397717 /DNA_START=128 /DNA_END=1312 /DNA_ORIENTATION=-
MSHSNGSLDAMAPPAECVKTGKLNILHIAGSPVSQYYSMISIHYCRQMLNSASDAATAASFSFTYAIVLPGGAWCIVHDLDEATIANAKKLSHGEAVAQIASADHDAAVPHMFCWPGYTSYRALMDLLRVPLVGCSPECMALITDKAQAKAVVASAGVPVPQGELLTAPSQTPTVPMPFVLKPCCEDNSMGISKVETAEELPAALAEAFKFDDTVVCESFIPLGREIRVAVVEDESGEPSTMLPATEYLLTPDHPMRTPTDKISVDDKGLPDADKFFATNRSEAPAYRRSACPAPLDDALKAKLEAAAKTAHKALRCRDFSIFDFRVDPHGEIYMLECQPVCSFARESAMIGMALKTDVPELQHPTLYHSMLRRAAARKPKPYNVSQVLGMKAK